MGGSWGISSAKEESCNRPIFQTVPVVGFFVFGLGTIGHTLIFYFIALAKEAAAVVVARGTADEARAGEKGIREKHQRPVKL